MKKISFLVAFLFFFITANAQNVTTVYLSKTDTTKNMFIAVMPDGGIDNVRNCMFLVNGMFSPVNDVLKQTELPLKAAQRGTLIIIPLFTTGIQSFGIDDSTKNSLKYIVDYCVSKYHLQSKSFYIGGFSIGGAVQLAFLNKLIQRII
jgi:hypothetical protein